MYRQLDLKMGKGLEQIFLSRYANGQQPCEKTAGQNHPPPMRAVRISDAGSKCRQACGSLKGCRAGGQSARLRWLTVTVAQLHTHPKMGTWGPSKPDVEAARMSITGWSSAIRRVELAPRLLPRGTRRHCERGSQARHLGCDPVCTKLEA